MGLSAEEKKQLEALTAKSKEPDSPPGNVNFNLDLSSDTAWERAQKLGLVPGNEEPPEEGDPESGDEGPRRRSRGGDGFFGDK